MPSTLLEITATYCGEQHRFANGEGDVIVGFAWRPEGGSQDEMHQVDRCEFKIKGPANLDDLLPLHEYRFFGRWSTYTNPRTSVTEKQFHFETFVPVTPHNKTGIVAYLVQVAKGHYFGVSRASKLFDLFGSEAVKELRERPGESAAALTSAGLPLAASVAQEISNKLIARQALEDATIELTELLNASGLPKSTPKKCLDTWGNRAAMIIRHDAYKLMQFRGCGFKRCDAIYLRLGRPPGRLKRQALAAWYALSSDSSGSTWHPPTLAENGIRGCIGGAELKIGQAMRLAVRSGMIAEVRTRGKNGPLAESVSDPVELAFCAAYVAEGKKSRNESDLARMIAHAMDEPAVWPASDQIPHISHHQSEQYTKATTGPIAVLGGGPGTGKTFTAGHLIGACLRKFGNQAVAVGAPTGKAAVRLTEFLVANKINLRARTWHSLLGVESHADRGGWGFKHGVDDPLPYKVLIGDEESMVDVDLAASVFRARARGTLVLLIGDVNQLAPVGHGAPLRDLIAAGLPYGELREIKRNSGGIVEACAAIRDGKRWGAGDNLKITDEGDPERQTSMMLESLRSAESLGLNPIWDCQILAAVNKKSKLSRVVLNKVLQQHLNHRPGIDGQPFRVGDKIVNTKNGFFPLVQGDTSDPEFVSDKTGRAYAANGELAEVIEVGKDVTIARLSGPERIIRISRSKDSGGDSGQGGEGSDSEEKTTTGCTWDLGYVLTPHKFQGSEQKHVIVLGDSYPGAVRLCDKSWLYTGISRGKQTCDLIGPRALFNRMCRWSSINGRKTFLKERILMERARIELGGI
jgi:exodeoxyribonuclease V alpha subunit